MLLLLTKNALLEKVPKNWAGPTPIRATPERNFFSQENVPQINSPIEAFVNASEEQIIFTTVAVCCKLIRDVVTVNRTIAPKSILDASSLISAKTESRPGAIVAISGVLVGEVKKVVKDEVVGQVIVAIRVAVTYLNKR